MQQKIGTCLSEADLNGSDSDVSMDKAATPLTVLSGIVFLQITDEGPAAAAIIDKFKVGKYISKCENKKSFRLFFIVSKIFDWY